MPLGPIKQVSRSLDRTASHTSGLTVVLGTARCQWRSGRGACHASSRSRLLLGFVTAPGASHARSRVRGAARPRAPRLGVGAKGSRTGQTAEEGRSPERGGRHIASRSSMSRCPNQVSISHYLSYVSEWSRPHWAQSMSRSHLIRRHVWNVCFLARTGFCPNNAPLLRLTLPSCLRGSCEHGSSCAHGFMQRCIQGAVAVAVARSHGARQGQGLPAHPPALTLVD